MKKLIFFTVSIFFMLEGNAQHKLTDQIQSLNWDLIGTIKFRKVSDKEIYPVYNEMVSRFANKSFELEGYMIPISAKGRSHSTFLLATLPLNQCYFCGKNGVPIMIVIEAAAPVKFTWLPIVVTGTLKLTNDNAAITSPVRLVNAMLSD